MSTSLETAIGLAITVPMFLGLTWLLAQALWSLVTDKDERQGFVTSLTRRPDLLFLDIVVALGTWAFFGLLLCAALNLAPPKSDIYWQMPFGGFALLVLRWFVLTPR
ncbi:hypothetical protein [Marinovum algicola]|uniref:hypothetical protein n=1 Tax=Marinovum algicola TaxID=42444 RepID=UPI003B5173C0